MKKEIHPEYIEKAKISCACGATYEIGSTEQEISVELCANCHPFYTGTQKIIDSARRVEKFQARIAKKTTKATGKKAKRAKRDAKKADELEKEKPTDAKAKKTEKVEKVEPTAAKADVGKEK